MKKLFLDIAKHPVSYIVASVIASAIGFTVFAIFYFWINYFSLLGAINGTGVAGALLVFTFVLVWLSRSGAFDTLSYSFNQMFASMFNRQANKYNDMVEYKQQKNIKRQSAGYYHFSFLVIGVLHLIAFGALEIVLHTLY